MIIYAVDPGKQTGICKFDTSHGMFAAFVYPAMEACMYLDSSLKFKQPDTFIVCERFITTSIKRSTQNDAIEVIGACRFLSHMYQVKFELQNRSDRMNVPIKLAREIAIFQDGRITDDELDAVRHAVVAVIRHGGIAYVPGYTHPLTESSE